MCFSASASFTAGSVLSLIGVATIRRVKQPTHIYFACIPLLFAAQQFTEGFLWLALTKPSFEHLQKITTFVFLFFAQVVWPSWVPFSIMKLKPKEKRKLWEKVLVVIGILVSVPLGYFLFMYPVEGRIIGYHISYFQNYPINISLYFGVFYILSTVFPPFLSHIRKMWFLGALILISYLVTDLMYTDYFVSVWCFFASVISMAVYIIIVEFKDAGGVVKVA